MAGAQQEDALIAFVLWQRHIGCSRHITREIITCMWHDDGCHMIILLVIGMKRQKTVNLMAQTLWIAIVKPACLRGWSHHRLLLTKNIHHDNCCYNCYEHCDCYNYLHAANIHILLKYCTNIYGFLEENM